MSFEYNANYYALYQDISDLFYQKGDQTGIGLIRELDQRVTNIMDSIFDLGLISQFKIPGLPLPKRVLPDQIQGEVFALIGAWGRICRNVTEQHGDNRRLVVRLEALDLSDAETVKVFIYSLSKGPFLNRRR